MKNPLFFATCVALACMDTVQAANTISGNLWHVSEATSQNAIPANVPGTPADVTFDVNSPFNFSASSDTVGNWLASSSAFNITENTLGTLASSMDDGTDGTLVEFSGLVTVANGQTFTVTHDDGLTLIINGIDLGFSPLPTAAVTDTVTYTGVSGTFPFQLVYGECCGGPAVLQVELPFRSAPVPETTSTLTLLGLSAVALIFGDRRKRTFC